MTLVYGFILILTLNATNSFGFLIGGKKAAANQYKSSVFINDSCSASKISSKFFLTAAHCVYDYSHGLIRENYLPLEDFTVKTHYGVSKVLTVKKTHIHYTFVDVVEEKLRQNQTGDTAPFAAFDIAIIEVNENSSEIPAAKIDFNYIKPDTVITIGGYGCVDQKWSKVTEVLYKIMTTKTVPESTLSFDSYSRNLSQAYNHNIYSKGFKMDSKSASLCPGDSGGPAYVNNKIVGINSQYIFVDRSGLSYINLHTRLSEVQDWVLRKLDNW